MSKLNAEWCKNHIESMKANGMSLLEEKYLSALEIALPILEQQERSGWIEWVGGECPVIQGKRVDLKLRGGVITHDCAAECGKWDHHRNNNQSDIIAYRIIPEQPKK